jgi:ATP-dependent Lon protease
VLAARRHGIKTFVLPQMNEQDLAELTEDVRRDMTFVPARTLEDVLDVALPAVGSPATGTMAAGGPANAAAAAPSSPASTSRRRT